MISDEMRARIEELIGEAKDKRQKTALEWLAENLEGFLYLSDKEYKELESMLE